MTERHCPPVPALDAYQSVESLSHREVEVLEQVAEGLRYADIAERFVISERTIRTHMRNVYAKLGCNNNIQAINRARRMGLLPVVRDAAELPTPNTVAEALRWSQHYMEIARQMIHEDRGNP